VPYVPTKYDPPQLRRDREKCARWATGHRTCGPCDPCSCCFSQLAKTCCLGPCLRYQQVRITSHEDWFLKMLQTGDHPNCPEFLKGIWWMQDNFASEALLTFHDAAWETNRLGIKSATQNWTTDGGNFWGSVLPLWWQLNGGGNHRLEISEDGKWISINGDMHWIYVIQPGDKFTRPDGSVLDVTPGQDMMRVSFHEGVIFFQYLVRKVAYLESPDPEAPSQPSQSRRLVLTKAYETLVSQATSPSSQGNCSQRDLLVSDRQQLHFAPPQQVM
jgi:hypothetical protein